MEDAEDWRGFRRRVVQPVVDFGVEVGRGTFRQLVILAIVFEDHVAFEHDQKFLPFMRAGHGRFLPVVGVENFVEHLEIFPTFAAHVSSNR
jgi:hypothetical protein